jgi:drug/metabolite transporter (DMT)-like permease
MAFSPDRLFRQRAVSVLLHRRLLLHYRLQCFFDFGHESSLRGHHLHLMGAGKANRRVFIGILVSILGVAIIVSGGLPTSFQLLGSTLGDLLIMGGAISFAIYTVFAKPLLASNSPLKVNTYMGLAGTVFLLPLTYSHLTLADWASVSLRVWAILLFCIVITAGVSLTLWYRGVSKIGPTKTQIYQNLIPVTTIASAVPLLGETVSALQVLGALVAVMGIYIARRG